MTKRFFTIAIIAALPLAACGSSNVSTDDDGQLTVSTTVDLPKNDAQKAYAEANAKMHKGMGNIPADADEAFMVGMIPNHQGAVDMAEIVLKQAKTLKPVLWRRQLSKRRKPKLRRWRPG